MELLALRNRGWAWCTREQREFFDGRRISAGVSAHDRVTQGAPMVTVEQVELLMVTAAAFRMRGQVDEALDQMDVACDRARAVPIDLRCLAEVQRAEVINSSGHGVRLIDESSKRLLRFRAVFHERVSDMVMCAINATLARTSLILGDALGALEWASKVGTEKCRCPMADVWMAVTRAQCHVLLDQPGEALAAAKTAADEVSLLVAASTDATIWAALAELAWQCGEIDLAWRWATHAIDVAEVRPQEVTPEFMPGDIAWTLGN
ncbi:MAG: hypothetical protein RL745_655 [Actinomycetota bacterium]